MIKFFDYFIDFFDNIIFSLLDFIFENELVLAFFLIPLLLSCIFVILDFIFNIRDDFGSIKRNNKVESLYDFKINYKYNKNKDKETFDFSKYYQQQKELADYKHNLKMQELNKFSDNYDKVHKDKMSYQLTGDYKKSAVKTQPKYNGNFEYKNSSYQQSRQKNMKYRKDLEIEYDENLAP